jgi:predicted transcriptional regulator
MPASTRALEKALATLDRARRRPRNVACDRTLQKLVAELLAARQRAGMTQIEVAERMWTTPSVISRLEAGRHARPTLSTIERYAIAVGCRLEVRLHDA